MSKSEQNEPNNCVRKHWNTRSRTCRHLSPPQLFLMLHASILKPSFHLCLTEA